jgi:hypothetical protein
VASCPCRRLRVPHYLVFWNLAKNSPIESRLKGRGCR